MKRVATCKTYPTPNRRTYTRSMFPALAPITPLQALGLSQVIELYLARLVQYLISLETSPQTTMPHDLAQKIASADWLVHGYIRMLTSMQLEHAGYTFHARAMRTPVGERTQLCRSDQGEVGSDINICSREPAVCLNQNQSYEPQTPEQLLTRLETVISNFQRAEHIASVLARMIACALAYIYPETSQSCAYTLPAIQIRRVGVRTPKTTPVGRGPPYPWPPPAMNLLVAVGRRCTANEFAEIPPIYASIFGGYRALRSTPPYQSHHSSLVRAQNKPRPRDPSAAINPQTKTRRRYAATRCELCDLHPLMRADDPRLLLAFPSHE